MFKTVCGLALGAFVLKRCAPRTYNQLVQAADDVVTATSDITTALRGQCAAYTAEAAKDAATRLQQVDPNAIAELRALLDEQPKPAQQPTAQHRPVRRRP